MQELFKKQLLKSACSAQWKKIGLNPHQGIIIILSALHSKKSPLCGEFLDLIPLIEWCPKIGLDFIQLLPINDSGFDNSPYNPISTFALNFIYLSLHSLPHFEKNSVLQKTLQKMQAQKVSKNFNYNKARAQKFKFLERYYLSYFNLIEKESTYKSFLKINPWVYEYGLYCALCEEHQTDQWQLWPKSCKSLNSKQKEALYEKFKERVDFYIMVQFFCFSQLTSVKKAAEKNKVFLMGDLPFLVSKTSCDVWSNPNLFLMNYAVGSPPDDLTPDGQNWNFPAYNWKELAKTDYKWWKTRLKISETFFHIYRLDHVIGFFRTWNIPDNKKGAEGHFVPKDPNLWLNHGKDFLTVLIKHSKMLPIGEDLVIPQTIKDVLRELGVCGTSILTWQRTGAGGMDFVPFPLYTAATITHIASHDTVTLAQWWNKYPKVAKLYALWKGWKYTKTLDSKKRQSILQDSHQTSSLFHANLLNEYLALFPKMVHKDYNKERINYPGTPSKRNWRYRFIPSVEQIVNSRKLSDAIKAITTLP
ncbi:MAG: hypothetical protein S4CHLAM6_04840 [Chlamydiae bacterium]|nr:hypothetical protein [Chlamydiota bacterium]